MSTLPKYELVEHVEVLRIEFADPIRFEAAAPYSGRRGDYAATGAVFRYAADEEPSGRCRRTGSTRTEPS
ncbi:hypothetical protein [Nonomuraea typhae]|uniref:Uncharacterized protein n=1 Tax=Nonomuraea typhae TaxID=2603600 RepID=A0ABW7YJD4_9ACTN